MGYGTANGIAGAKHRDMFPQHWAETGSDAYPKKECGQKLGTRIRKPYSSCVLRVRKPTPGNLHYQYWGPYIRHRELDNHVYLYINMNMTVYIYLEIHIYI